MPAASVQLNGFVPATTPKSAPSVRRPSLFTRFVDAIHDAQVRRAEREIGRFIESRGGRMTDDLERRIEKHFV